MDAELRDVPVLGRDDLRVRQVQLSLRERHLRRRGARRGEVGVRLRDRHLRVDRSALLYATGGLGDARARVVLHLLRGGHVRLGLGDGGMHRRRLRREVVDLRLRDGVVLAQRLRATEIVVGLFGVGPSFRDHRVGGRHLRVGAGHG